MSSASEGTPLLGLGGLGLAVDEAAVTTQLASEWGWNMTLGAITFIGGIFALMSPVTATVIVVTFISCALIVIGTFTLFGVCFAEPPYRLPSLFLGGIQLALGICMSTHLVESMVVLTGIVAVMYMIAGIFQCAIALGNSGMPNQCSYLFSGICSILFSVIVWSAFPASSVYTLGIILGVNWITSGIFRMFLGFQGRSAAKTLMGTGSGSAV